MSKEKKPPSKEIKSKSDNKNIFLFIGLILISGFAAIYLIKNKPPEKNQSLMLMQLKKVQILIQS